MIRYMPSLQSILQKIETSNSDQAFELAEKLLSQSRSDGELIFQVKALRHLAICSRNAGKLADAETFAREAIDIAEEQGFQRNLLLNINTLSGIIVL